MAEPTLSVAVIGLGHMGSAIAGRVLDAGFPLSTYNRTAAKAAPLVERGARSAATPREAVAAADVVITSLLDDASVDAVLGGPDGLLAGMQPHAIHICATTISPQQSQRLADAHAGGGSTYVTGPVLGRPSAAALGKLATLVSGPASAIERARPVLSSYTVRIVELGPDVRMASDAKLLANYVAYASLELIGQVQAYAERCGVGADYARQLLGATFAHPGLQEYNARVAGRHYDQVEFSVRGGLKDLDLIAAATASAGTPLAYAGIVRDRFLAADANGMGNLDLCAIAEISRGLAGLATDWTVRA